MASDLLFITFLFNLGVFACRIVFLMHFKADIAIMVFATFVFIVVWLVSMLSVLFSVIGMYTEQSSGFSCYMTPISISLLLHLT